MNRAIITFGFSISAAAVAIAIMILMIGNPATFGEYSLLIRACLLNLGIFACFGALFPFFSSYFKIDRKILTLVILASSLPAFIFFLSVVPSKTIDEQITKI